MVFKVMTTIGVGQSRAYDCLLIVVYWEEDSTPFDNYHSVFPFGLQTTDGYGIIRIPM